MTQVVHTPITARTPVAGADFGRITGEPAAFGAPDFAAIHGGPGFTALRHRFRRFAFPMAALFFLWYLTYVLLAAYARELMGQRLFGLVTVGLVLGLLQFVSTAAVTIAYVRYARRHLDPVAAELRAAAEVAAK